jgi:hypothetical protein
MAIIIFIFNLFLTGQTGRTEFFEYFVLYFFLKQI